MTLTALWPALIFPWTAIVSPGAAAGVVAPCDQNRFDFQVDGCLSDFNRSMEDRGYQDRCPWPDVKSFYDNLSSCISVGAVKSRCVGHLVDEVFLKVHHSYFSLCTQVHDPPLLFLVMFVAPGVVFTLVTPFLCVHLTSWSPQMDIQ